MWVYVKVYAQIHKVMSPLDLCAWNAADSKIVCFFSLSFIEIPQVTSR